MKLLGGDTSPYVRKARIAAREKGLNVEFVAASPSNPESGVAAANPLSKIPALALDDGGSVYDSSVIVEYFDGLAETPKLIPVAFKDRVAVKQWEALGNGVADAIVEISHDRRKPPEKRQGAELEAKQMKKVRAGVAAMERDLGAKAFCHGESFSLADIACFMALNYASKVLTEFDWRAQHPTLAKHYDKLAARPAFQA